MYAEANSLMSNASMRDNSPLGANTQPRLLAISERLRFLTKTVEEHRDTIRENMDRIAGTRPITGNELATANPVALCALDDIDGLLSHLDILICNSASEACRLKSL